MSARRTTPTRKEQPWTTVVPDHQPREVAPDTFLIPNLAPAGDGVYVPVNSLLIRGEEPIVVDTGAPVHREHWLEHGLRPRRPGRHPLGLPLPRGRRPRRRPRQVLEAAPQRDARHELVQHRAAGAGDAGAARALIWREPGETLRRRRPSPPPRDAADLRRPRHPRPVRREDRRAVGGRHLRRRSPPAPSTGSRTSPRTCTTRSFMFFNSLISPWHQWLDPAATTATSTPSRRSGPASSSRPRPDPGRRRHPRRLRPGAHTRRRADHRPAGPAALDEILATVIEQPAA